MEQNVQTDLSEPQRSASTSAASDMSKEEDELLDLHEPQAGTLTSAIVSVTSNEGENASKRSQQKRSKREITGIQVQPISVSLAFGAKSTLQGTPWEEALGGATRPRSKTARKPTQRTVKEMEIISFWTQFFG